MLRARMEKQEKQLYIEETRQSKISNARSNIVNRQNMQSQAKIWVC